MKDANCVLFRAEIFQHYIQGREEPVLPRLICPCTFLCLWLLLGLLVASGFLAWCARVPVYASGLAVMADGRDSTPSARDEALDYRFCAA